MSRISDVPGSISVSTLLRSLFKRKRPARGRLQQMPRLTGSGTPAETLEQRLLLAGVNDDPANPEWDVEVSDAAASDVTQLLTALNDVAAATASDSTSRILSTVDLSLNDLLDVDENSTVVRALDLSDATTLLNSPGPHSVHDLAVVIDTAVQPFGGTVDVDLSQITDHSSLQLRVMIDHGQAALVTVPVRSNQFGSSADSPDVSGDITVDAEAKLQVDVLLSVDLGATARDEAALQLNQLDVSANLNDAVVPAEVRYHFATLTGDGSATGSATTAISLNDPTPGTPGLTLSELGSQPVGSLINESSSGSVSLTLPLTTDVSGFALIADASPTLTITDSDLFDEDVFANSAGSDFESFAPFTEVSARQFQAALTSVANAFDDIDHSALLAAEIPLTNGQTLNHLVDVSDVFTAEFLASLTTEVNGTASPTYATVQELRRELQSLAGGSISDVVFVSATATEPASIRLALSMSAAMDSVVTPLDLSTIDSASNELNNLHTDAVVDLTPHLNISTTIDVGLTPVSDGFVLTPSTLLASLNGGGGILLASDNKADVEVALRDGTKLQVIFDGATRIDDVIAAYNSHVGNDGGSGPGGRKFTVSISEDALRLQVTDHTAAPAGSGNRVKISAINGSLAAFGLGLIGQAGADDGNTLEDESATILGAALHGRSVADHVRLSNLVIEPSVELLAQSIDATGHLNAIEVSLDRLANSSSAAVDGHFLQQITLANDSQSVADLVRDLNDSPSLVTATFGGEIDLNWGLDVTGHLGAEVDHSNAAVEGSIVIAAETSSADYAADGATTSVTIQNADDVQRVSSVSTADVAGVLRSAGTLLGELELLQDNLPLLGLSLADLAPVHRELATIADALLMNLDTPLQDLGGIVTEAIASTRIDNAVVTPGISLRLDESNGGLALRIDLDLDFAAANSVIAARLDRDSDRPGIQVPLHFDVKELGLPVSNLIDASGDSLVTVDVNSRLQLSLGLGLVGPDIGKTFLYESDNATNGGTSLTVELTAKASDVSFEASVGAFGATINGGSMAITGSEPFASDFSVAHATPAIYRIDLSDGDDSDDGRLTIDEATDSDADVLQTTVAAFAFAYLPTYFPSATNHIGNFELRADLQQLNDWRSDSSAFHSDVIDGAIAVTTPEGQPVFVAGVPTFDNSNLDLGSNMSALVGGWDGVFDIIIEAMKGEVLGVNIPLIGDALSDQARWLEDIRDTVVDTFGGSDADGEGNYLSLNSITNVFYSALGPDGVNLLKDRADDDDELVNVDDIVVEETRGAGGFVDGVLFHLPLGRTVTLPQDVAFDLGLPGIGLDVDGGVQLEAELDFNLAIGLSISDGVYLQTSDDSELELTVTATVPNLSATGTIGLLQVDVTDDANNPTAVVASFVVDLRDVDDDDHLTFSELHTSDASDILAATLSADVGVNLNLLANFGANADIPRVRSDLSVDWEFEQTFGTDATQSEPSTSPEIAFNNVALNLGDFVTNFVQPLAERVQQFTEPVQPILDIIDDNVPVLSEMFGDVTWLQLAKLYGGAEIQPYLDAVETVQDLIDLTNALANLDNDPWIELGSFTVAGDDALDGDKSGSVSPSTTTAPAIPLNQQLSNGGANGLNDHLSGSSSHVINFPLLQDPGTVFALFMGQDVDLVIFDLPELSLDFRLSRRIPFPPFPVLYGEIGGGIAAKVDLSVGYDTIGLRRFLDTRDASDLLDGLFVSDRANSNGTGADVPEAALQGYVYVQGGIDAGIYSGGVTGKVAATVNFNLHDYADEFSNQTDGKIRATELDRSLKLGAAGLHTFDVGGSVDADLSAYLRVDLLLGSYTKHFDIAATRLLDYNISRPAESRPTLATKSGSTLTLSTTADADHIVVLPGTDANDPNRVVVRTFAADGSTIDTRGFAGITRIVAPASDGDDVIEIDHRLQQTVQLNGGAGNDRLVAGGGKATLNGGSGDDILIGSPEADTISGGSGADMLTGFSGDDALQGDAGNDIIYGGLGNDSIEGGAGNDTLFGEAGDDIIRGGDGDDTIDGADGDDRLFGESGNDIITGANGRDILQGGAGNDNLSGGRLSDELFGGAGDDIIDGGDSNDTIYGNTRSFFGFGGIYRDTGNGNNTLIGGAGSDMIFSGTGNDFIYAGAFAIGSTYSATDRLAHQIHVAGGNNTIFGDLGDETITTGDGIDVIHAFEGVSQIEAGNGDNTITAGNGDALITTGDGDDSVTVGDGQHEIRAGEGGNSITAGNGDALITSGDGDDSVTVGDGEHEIRVGDGANHVVTGNGTTTVFSGAGSDTITTGNGNDHIESGAGHDEISSGSGDDFVIAGDGNDVIDAGSGDDVIYGNRMGSTQIYSGLFDSPGNGSNTITGGLGNELISAGTGGNTIFAGDGPSASEATSHVISAPGGNNAIYGDLGEDLILTGSGSDTVTTFSGNDTVDAGAGDNVIKAIGGDNVIVAGTGDDAITTGAGRDLILADGLPSGLDGNVFDGTLRTRVDIWTTARLAVPHGANGNSIDGNIGDGADHVDAGAGNDVVFTGGGTDVLRGGEGDDFLDAGAGSDDIFGGGGQDILLGGANNDRVFGNAGIDQLYGGFGDDILFAGAGEDGLLEGQTSWGGDGVDQLYAWAAVDNSALPNAIQAETLLPGDTLDGGNGNDFLYGNLRSERLNGGNGNDTLLGDWLAGPGIGEETLPQENTHKSTVGGNDLLVGGSGEDQISGHGGDDRLFGGADSDRLEGHSGSDELNGGLWIDLLVMDVSPLYPGSDVNTYNGHGLSALGEFVPDDNATDVLNIEGDADAVDGEILTHNDIIQIGQRENGQLLVNYNGRLLAADWQNGNGPVVEQFQVDGLVGDDVLTFVPTNGDLLPLDVSALSNRTDFVGVLNGGPGNDRLVGTSARDRLDGGSDSDTLFGHDGNDRLFGGSAGSSDVDDVLFAGSGNDDLVGGPGRNTLYAWTQDPSQGDQFGVFVNAAGQRFDNNGDLDGDGRLDDDPTLPAHKLEDTGLNRMLGSAKSDVMYGGTGLDFIYGNGGTDQHFGSDGRELKSDAGSLEGEEWVETARQQAGVWYVGGSNRDDHIEVDYVTEDGVLSGRHIVTRSTTIDRDDRSDLATFSVSIELDFGAKDENGDLIWNPKGHAWDVNKGGFVDDTLRLSALLPPESSLQAIIIDALAGDDTIIVGETVQTTVWVSAGAGNDFVHIESGNALLPDQTEIDGRNDTLNTAFTLERPAQPAVLVGVNDVPANGQLSTESRFRLRIGENASVPVVIPKATLTGADGSANNQGIDHLVEDINAALKVSGLYSDVVVTRDGQRVQFVSVRRGDAAALELTADANDPIVTELGFDVSQRATGSSKTSQFGFTDLTIDGVEDEDFYELVLTQPTGDFGHAEVSTAPTKDGLTTSLYKKNDDGQAVLLAVNPDSWESSDDAAQNLDDVNSLAGITGLTLHTGNDVDRFTFQLNHVGTSSDYVMLRQTAGDSPLNLSLQDPNGNTFSPTVRNGNTRELQFRLQNLPVGSYTLQVSSATAARYEFVASVGSNGTELINLNDGETVSVPLANLPAGDYYVHVASPNLLPTVYDLNIDLGHADAASAAATNLANQSYRIERRDVITGGDGHDVLIGGLGEDWIFGGDGDDVLSGGLDRQAGDLLIGGNGSDTFQIITDALPLLEGTDDTFVPTINDQFDGGEGEDRVLYLGGNFATHPVTTQQVAIPDYVSLRYNTIFHRYEFTSLRYDIANDRFEVADDGQSYVQDYQFFQANSVEQMVIDVQAGDDVVRADAEYKLPGQDSEWGIKLGTLQQGGLLGQLTIEGGDGNDVLFGGDLNDTIDGGHGNDIIVGGLGDDLLFGGTGNDHIVGGRTTVIKDTDIMVPTLDDPSELPAPLYEAVYVVTPFATAHQQPKPKAPVTVQSENVSLSDADHLQLTGDDESIEDISTVGDVNADGHADFVVTSNKAHYLFFGPTDLASLDLVSQRTGVDPRDLATRADVRIDLSVGTRVAENVNINGDVDEHENPINDLLFMTPGDDAIVFNILFGVDREMSWPRSIESLDSVNGANVRTNVSLNGVNAIENLTWFDYTGNGQTDLLANGQREDGVRLTRLVSGSNIASGKTETYSQFELPIQTEVGRFDGSIRAVSDLNGDGRADIVGILAADPQAGRVGRVYVHYARPELPSVVDLAASYDRLLTDQYIDGSLTTPGDVNSDGFQDLIFRQPRVDTAGLSGAFPSKSDDNFLVLYGQPEQYIDLSAAIEAGQTFELDSTALDGLSEATIELDFRLPATIHGTQTLLSSLNEDGAPEFAVYLHPESRIEVRDQGHSSFWTLPIAANDTDWHHLTILRQPSRGDTFTGSEATSTNPSTYSSRQAETPITGARTIRVESTLSDRGYTSLAEVAIFDVNGGNVALTGTATQSSTNTASTANRSDANSASFAIDGDIGGLPWLQATTFDGNSHWWEVKLADNADIRQIDLFSLQAHSANSNSVRVVVLDEVGNTIWTRDLGEVSDAHVKAFQTVGDVEVVDESGQVRTFEIETEHNSSVSGYVVTETGQRIDVVTVAGQPNRMRPVSGPIEDLQPNGHWQLFLEDANSNSPILSESWTLHLETSDQIRSWQTSIGGGPFVGHSAVDESKVRELTGTLQVSGRVDSDGQFVAINGLDFDMTVVDLAGERLYSSTLTSPEGTTVELGGLTVGATSAFNGENPNGVWTLTVDTGTDGNTLKPQLHGWQIELATADATTVLVDRKEATPKAQTVELLNDANGLRQALGRYVRIDVTDPNQALNIESVRVIDVHGHSIEALGIIETDDQNSTWLLDLGYDRDISDVVVSFDQSTASSQEEVVVSIERHDGAISFRNRVSTRSSLLKATYSAERINSPNVTIEQVEGALDFGNVRNHVLDNSQYPGYRIKNAEWNGQVYIPEDGNVEFSIELQGDAKLYIDGIYRLHAFRPNIAGTFDSTVNLSAGFHDIRITDSLFGSGSTPFKLMYTLPGQDKVVIPADAFATSEFSLFNSLSPTRALSLNLDAPADASDVTQLEIQTSHTGENLTGHLVAPDGSRYAIAQIEGSRSRFVFDVPETLHNWNGIWTVVLAAPSGDEFTFDEATVVLYHSAASGQIQTTSQTARRSDLERARPTGELDVASLMLGQNVRPGVALQSTPFSGHVDNVRVWDHLLLADQSETLTDPNLAVTNAKARLTGEWDFNRGDAAGHVSGSALLPIATPANNVRQLRGGDIELDHSILDGLSEFSVEVRISMLTRATSRLLSGGGDNFSIDLEGDSTVVVYLDEVKYEWQLSEPVSDAGWLDNDPEDRSWNELSIVRSAESIEVFLNGISQGIRNASAGVLSIHEGELRLGTTGTADGFVGQLDNLRIWSEARTAQQVADGRGGEVIDPRSQSALNGYFRFNQSFERFVRDDSQHQRPGRVISELEWSTPEIGYFSSAARIRPNTGETLLSQHTQSLVADHAALWLNDNVSANGETELTISLVADVNGNGVPDLLVQLSSPSIVQSGYYIITDTSIANGNSTFRRLIAPGLSGVDADHLLGSADVDGDGISDLLFSAADTSGDQSKLSVVRGEFEQLELPRNFHVITNRSVTGSGDFIVKKDTAETFTFDMSGLTATDDGRVETWIQFTTLGDGVSSDNVSPSLTLSQHVRADLVNADGGVMVKNFRALDLTDLAAGTYFLRVSSFAADTLPEFAVNINAPKAGVAFSATDRDQIYAGEGRDWINGGAFRDIIFGNEGGDEADDATDSVIAEPIEFRDTDTFPAPSGTVFQREALTAPAVSETISNDPYFDRSRLHATIPTEASIFGRVFDDVNKDEKQDANEPFIDGMKIILRSAENKFVAETRSVSIDLNGDGTIDPQTETGVFFFGDLKIEEYLVTSEPQNGWTWTTSQQVAVDLNSAANVVQDFGFREILPTSITGVLFNDVDNDGKRSSAEGVLSNWTVNLFDESGNKVASTKTNSDGEYTFANILPGHYLVERAHQSGWGPDSGELESLRKLFTRQLGLFLTEVDFTTWDESQPLRSRTGLWYAFTTDRRLLQGATAANAHAGTQVRDLSATLDSEMSLKENLQRIQHVFGASAVYVEVLEEQTTETVLRAHEIGPGSIAGNVFEDFNRNGVQNSGEGGLGGVTVMLLGPNGDVLDDTTTDEFGNYTFSDVHVGLKFVAIDVAHGVEEQTTPQVDREHQRAWQIDQDLDLRYTGKYFENWGGLGEKWMWGSGQREWYYITPDGQLFEWNKSGFEDLSGRYIDTLPTEYHTHPDRLLEARIPGTLVAIVTEGQETAVRGFGVLQSARTTLTGTVFLDEEGNQEREATDYALNGGTVELLNEDGVVVDSTTTKTIDLNNDGTIDLLTENGVYVFENVPLGNYHVRVERPDDVAVTHESHYAELVTASELNHAYQLQQTDFVPRNGGSRNEIWLEGFDPEFDRAAMFYLLSNGELVMWNGSEEGILKGTSVGKLSPQHHQDAALLHSAAPLGAVYVRVDDETGVSGPNIGLHPLDESAIDQLMSVWDLVATEAS